MAKTDNQGGTSDATDSGAGSSFVNPPNGTNPEREYLFVLTPLPVGHSPSKVVSEHSEAPSLRSDSTSTTATPNYSGYQSLPNFTTLSLPLPVGRLLPFLHNQKLPIHENGVVNQYSLSLAWISTKSDNTTGASYVYEYPPTTDFTCEQQLEHRVQVPIGLSVPHLQSAQVAIMVNGVVTDKYFLSLTWTWIGPNNTPTTEVSNVYAQLPTIDFPQQEQSAVNFHLSMT